MVNSKVRQYTLNQAIILVVFCNLDFSIFELSAKIRFRCLSRFPRFNGYNVLRIIQNTQQGAPIKIEIQRQLQTGLWLPIVLHYDNDIYCIISWFFCRQFLLYLICKLKFGQSFKYFRQKWQTTELKSQYQEFTILALTVMSSSLNVVSLLQLKLKLIWGTEPTVGRLD